MERSFQHALCAKQLRTTIEWEDEKNMPVVSLCIQKKSWTANDLWREWQQKKRARETMPIYGFISLCYNRKYFHWLHNNKWTVVAVDRPPSPFFIAQNSAHFFSLSHFYSSFGFSWSTWNFPFSPHFCYDFAAFRSGSCNLMISIEAIFCVLL